MLVVGAGPAGGELARLLAARGVSVELVDRLPDLHLVAFSSAGMPLEAVERFGLPASVVASRWRGWRLIGPGDRSREWLADHTLGVVLDFGALRHWLAEECRAAGGVVKLGRTVLGCRPEGERLRTSMRDRDGCVETVLSDWVIDATGERRCLLGAPARRRDPLLSAVGVEWLLEVPRDGWSRWQHRLSFCLGSDWCPQGYGWVFPMEPGVLKVGLGRFCDPKRDQPPLAPLLTTMLERLLEPTERERMRVLDRHGGRIRSRIRRREPHQRGRLIGLGDVVSTANLLGGEGIRHALTSSRVLAPLLLENLGEPPGRPIRGYPRQLRRALGWRWTLSGRVARRTWLGLREEQADRKLEGVLRGLESHSSAEDLSALLFDYRFERFGLRILPYLLGWR